MSIQTLGKIAIYGAVGSVLSSGYFYKSIQDKIAGSPFYVQTMSVVRNHTGAMEVLGEPLRSKFVSLSSKANTMNGYNAQLQIPVKGSKRSGTVHSWSSRKDTSEEWFIEKVDLELYGSNKQVTIYLGDNVKSTAEGYAT
ncbi:cytochrome c oxidase assembly factor 1 homolog [Antedon mediterranea]|uniref:cytochrome c oxidase assembly factor 1 homolog n=1 Tax=Antedon mediterranea TaxID=105859 RepID=UPI003AF46992